MLDCTTHLASVIVVPQIKTMNTAGEKPLCVFGSSPWVQINKKTLSEAFGFGKPTELSSVLERFPCTVDQVVLNPLGLDFIQICDC